MRTSSYRAQFGQTVADALLLSATDNMPAVIYYEPGEGRFEFANTYQVSEELIALLEIDARSDFEPLPLEDAGALKEALQEAQNEASDYLYEMMLPDIKGLLHAD